MKYSHSLVRSVRTVSILGFSTLAGLSTTVPLWAQEAPLIAAVEKPAYRSSSALEEIVVSARRRDESAQEVPIALSVLRSDAIESTGTFTLSEVPRLAPSLQVFSFNPRNTNINIRGLGGNVAATNDGLENGVGVYVDNVYYGRPGQSQFDLIDLEQIEVLRGPQGTLFGKNTTAGAINITTRKPSFETELKSEFSYASEGFKQVRSSFSGPLIEDTLAYRLTVGHTERDGLVENIHDGKELNDYQNSTARGQLLFLPRDGVELRVIGDYAEQKAAATANSIVRIFTHYDNGVPIANSVIDRFDRAGYSLPSNDPFDRKVDLNSRVRADMESYGLSAQLDWELDNGQITAISAYRGWNWDPENDVDYTSLDILPFAQQKNRQRQFSQEVRFASQGNEKLDYVAGVYYLWQSNKGYGDQGYGEDAAAWYLPQLPADYANAIINGYGGQSFSEPETHSYAAFGQVVWHLSDTWELTTGLRYTYEDKTGVFEQAPTRGASLDGLTPQQRAQALAIRENFYATQSYDTEFSDESVSGLVSLSHRLSDSVLVYASYARGGKSGGLNLTALPAGVSPEVEPEKVDNVEVGLKSQWLDDRLTFNLALFNTEIDDYQTAISEVKGDTGIIQYVANAGDVRSRGAEVDVAYHLNDFISLTGSLSYIKATYLDYRNAQQAPENYNLGAVQDLTGEALPGVPELAWNVGVDVAYPIENFLQGIELYSSANYAYRDGYHTSVTNSRYSQLDDLSLLSARVGLRTFDGRWDLSLWGKNLTDKAYFVTLGPSTTGQVSGQLGEPRLVGATLRVTF